MKTAIVALAVLLALCAPVFAEDSAPAVDLPVYPGAETSMEINMTNQDILPMIKAMLPMMGEKLGQLGKQVQPEEIAEVLKDVSRLEVLKLDVRGSKVQEKDVTGFYAKNLPTGKWSRVFYQSVNGGGGLSVYARDGGNGLYAFRVRNATEDSRPIKTVEVAKLEGRIDFVKLVTLAAKVWMPSAAAPANPPAANPS